MCRGLVRKLYHSSSRTQRRGRCLVAAVPRSRTFTVATWNCALTEPGWSRKYAPTRPPYQAQSYSVSEAAWMPAYPPPRRM